MRPLGAVLLVAAATVLAGCAESEPPQPDPRQPESSPAVVVRGDIWTGNSSQPHAAAVGFLGEEIVAVGDHDRVVLETRQASGAEPLLVELPADSLLVPGFSDNHVHFASAARFLEFNIMTVGTEDEFLARLDDVVSRLDSGEWITGGLWGAYDQWQQGADASGGAREPFVPNMRRAASHAGDHPIFLQRFDNTEFAVNERALELSGVELERLPQGVDAVRDDQGFTGILTGERVPELFRGSVPEPSAKRRLRQTRNALREVARRGVTNVSDMSDDTQLDIYRQLHERGELTTRIHLRYPLDRWAELAEQGIEIGSGDPWIRLGSLKGHIDGIMGNSTARFFEPYDHDPSNRGAWRRLMVDDAGNFVEGQFLQYMLDADKAGLQLSIHAIGDEANSLLLDYLEELERQNGKKDRRFRLVHAQVIAKDDFERLARLGVVAEVQPFHLSDDMRWMEERIGHGRCYGAYAFAQIEDAGAVLSFGSDWPGTGAAEYPIDPLLGIYAAVSRQTTSGTPEGGWFPEQRIDTETALRAYTWGSSYANFEDDQKGTIEVGKLADFAVLDRNILELGAERVAELLDADVVLTVVGGRAVFDPVALFSSATQ